jgi:uncharacterized membrane protein
MFRPTAALAMLACGCVLIAPASAIAQDPAAEVPDVALSEAQSVTTGPSYRIATASATPRLWATVNICDTGTSPDSMGIRAGMPGNASGQRMFMRFRAEYWSRSQQDWAPVAGSGVSPWVYVGPARHERRQAGWTFEFAAPPAGVTFTMRALVEFQWRRADQSVALKRRSGKRRHAGRRGRSLKRVRRFDLRGRKKASTSRVVRSVTRATETGISGVDGGDPAGTSKAMCLIY